MVEGLAGRPRDGLYEPALADTEREAVADLLQYLENVCLAPLQQAVFADMFGIREVKQTSSQGNLYKHSVSWSIRIMSTFNEVPA